MHVSSMQIYSPSKKITANELDVDNEDQVEAEVPKPQLVFTLTPSNFQLLLKFFEFLS